jgi:hypothetical protein
MWYVHTLPLMCPDDKCDLTLALYEAHALSAPEAALVLLYEVGGEGAAPPLALPWPVVPELLGLLRGPLGQELAASNPTRYQSLWGCCGAAPPL